MLQNRLSVEGRFFKNPSKEKWESAVKAGITETEIFVDFRSAFNMAAIIEGGENEYRLPHEAGVCVSSIHLPFAKQIDISGPGDCVADYAVEFNKRLIDWAAEKKVETVVIHPSYEPIGSEDRQKRLSRAVTSIKTLGDYAKSKHLVLAVENLPRTCLGNCSGEMLILTDYGKNASICFDVNHLLCESHRDFYTNTAPYVVTTHISDYDFLDEKHWLIGDGLINWKELMGFFVEYGYQGRLMFELDENASPKLLRTFSPAELVDRFVQAAGFARMGY